MGKKSKRVLSLAKPLQGMASLWEKGCVNLFYSQVCRDKLSLQELNKSTLVYSRAEGQGPPGKPLSMITRAMESKSRKQFPTWRQNWLPPCNNICHDFILVQPFRGKDASPCYWRNSF